MEGEMKERRKIQFSVPSAVPTQLDPRQVEMIRRRRPTPATLFRMTDHPSPEEENPSHQLSVCENGVSKSKLVTTAVYQPPSIKAVQQMVEAHLQTSDTVSPSPDSSDNEEASPDSEPDQADDIKSDQSEHQSDEDTGSQEDIRGPTESREDVDKSAGNRENPPADTRSDQSERHSACVVKDDDTGSAQLRDVSGNESKEGVTKRAGKTDNGKMKEKEKD